MMLASAAIVSLMTFHPELFFRIFTHFLFARMAIRLRIRRGNLFPVSAFRVSDSKNDIAACRIRLLPFSPL